MLVWCVVTNELLCQPFLSLTLPSFGSYSAVGSILTRTLHCWWHDPRDRHPADLICRLRHTLISPTHTPSAVSSFPFVDNSAWLIVFLVLTVTPSYSTLARYTKALSYYSMINNHYRHYDENRRLIIQDPNDDEDAEWLTIVALIINEQMATTAVDPTGWSKKYGAEYDSMDSWIWWMKKE